MKATAQGTRALPALLLLVLAGATVAAFVPLSSGTIPFGCGINESVSRDVLVKIVAQAAVIAGMCSLFRLRRLSPEGLQASIFIIGLTAVVLTIAALAFSSFAARLGLELSTNYCGGAWRNAGMIALFWSSPPIALLLDVTTTWLIRRRWARAWSVLWSVASIVLHAVGYWSLRVGT